MITVTAKIGDRRLDEVTSIVFPSNSEVVITQNYIGQHLIDHSDEEIEIVIQDMPETIPGRLGIDQKYTGRVGEVIAWQLTGSCVRVMQLTTTFSLTSPMRLASITYCA
jgi:hypothetical protein